MDARQEWRRDNDVYIKTDIHIYYNFEFNTTSGTVLQIVFKLK